MRSKFDLKIQRETGLPKPFEVIDATRAACAEYCSYPQVPDLLLRMDESVIFSEWRNSIYYKGSNVSLCFNVNG